MLPHCRSLSHLRCLGGDGRKITHTCYHADVCANASANSESYHACDNDRDDDDTDHGSVAGMDEIDVALAALMDDMDGDSPAMGAVVAVGYDVSSRPDALGFFGTEDEQDLEFQSALPGTSTLTDEQRRLETLKTPLRPSIGWYSRQIPKPPQNGKKPDKKVKAESTTKKVKAESS